MMHLTVRVAWHDSRWNGTVCNDPRNNSFCVALDRIREERDDEAENLVRGKALADLQPDKLPACKAESGAFMSDRSWLRVFKHPYQGSTKTQNTHGHLKPRPTTIPEYSAIAVPFWWMQKNNQKSVQATIPAQLSPDEDAPFHTPWVFGRTRQEELLKHFFNHVKDKESGEPPSLAFFYTKEGQPIDETISRLIVGVGTIEKMGKLLWYDTIDRTRPSYPLWDRVIRHSIRPEGADGFLLPYHDYLEPTEDPDENIRRRDLAFNLAVVPPLEHIRTFSYVSELASADVALGTLTRCLAAIRLIKQHGIAKGAWDKREEWVNAQISRVWKERGAFPGLGSTLEALGVRLGTALMQELIATKALKPDDNPWPLLDLILSGRKSSPAPAYSGDLEAIHATWMDLSKTQKEFLKLLARFDLTPKQARRWFHAEYRPSDASIEDLLNNPYRIAEDDLGTSFDRPISINTVDRGLFPDSTIAARHPVPMPSAVASPIDSRRIRATLVAVLRKAAIEGDALLSDRETLERAPDLHLDPECHVTEIWLNANSASLAGTIERLSLRVFSGRPKELEMPPIPALQLTTHKDTEESLAKILRARASKSLPSTNADWKTLIIQAIRIRGGTFDKSNPRHVAALAEQAEALESITTRKLSILTGRAGTGKTSALGALLLCTPLQASGVLLLAPTGKARVLLGKASGTNDAKTIAQFLNSLGRYDGEHQLPMFDPKSDFAGKDKYHKEKTVVIDECSMVTMDTLYAVFRALDMTHVERIILVGDPNQLPPIGVGRPFADFCALLENVTGATDSQEQNLSQALGRLTVEVRSAQTTGERSDTLRLASWFTREPQPVDADQVFDDLTKGKKLNDLEVRFWESPDELRNELFSIFQAHLDLSSPNDVAGFDKALGLNEKRWVPFDHPEGAEYFQVLSPVRMHPYGIYELNRLIQRRFRGPELDSARMHRQVKLGDEEIVIRDKVIQLDNQIRGAYNNTTRQSEELYLANGEIGICATTNSSFLNVVFAGRPGYTVGYTDKDDFRGGSGPLELAYALTVHKAQGSEFRKVFVILPKECRLLTRELLYTALTRSRYQMVLLMEGRPGDLSPLYEFSRPDSSETVRRNTNLFHSVLRVTAKSIPYAEHLIHRAPKGHMVRSKSELVIANILYDLKIDYTYEPEYEGHQKTGIVRPDFMFSDPAGEPIIWEHLGMLSKPDYRKSWERKRQWYLDNGFVEGQTLFTTQDGLNGSLDSTEVRVVAEKVKTRI